MSRRNRETSLGPEHVRENTDTEQAIRILAGLRDRISALEETKRGDESIPTLYRDATESIVVADAVEVDIDTSKYAYDSPTTRYDFSEYDGTLLNDLEPQKRYITNVPAGETITIADGETAYVKESDDLEVDGSLNLDGALNFE